MSSCGLFFKPVTQSCAVDEILYRCVMNMWVLAQLVSFMLLLQLQALDFARPFGDFMVLPHDQSIPLWGSGAPASEIKVTFGTQSKSTHCGADGRWRLILNPEKPSAQGRELILTSSGEKRSLKDVLVGEIWLCSGQSNMDFPLGKAIGGKVEAAQAGNFPAIRLCNLTAAPTDSRVYDNATLARLNTKDHFVGKWSIATEPSALEISAIAWWTAKELHGKNGIPIGVVENAVGGSGAEAWLPSEILESRDDYKALLGDEWLDCPKIGNWARGRAKLNLGTHRSAMHPFRPGFLFESGVREWTEFPFAGVLWYQGETNAEMANDDWNATARHAMGELLRNGHRHIGIVMPRDGLRGNVAALQGASSVAEAGIRLTEIWEDGTTEGMIAALIHALKQKNAPTAFITLRPRQAICLLTWMGSQGWQIPKHFSLISLATEALFSSIVPTIATYHIDAAVFAKRVVKRLELLVDGQIAGQGVMLLIPTFVPGASIASR